MKNAWGLVRAALAREFRFWLKAKNEAPWRIPIGAETNPEKFKLLFLDVGLTNALLEFDLSSWFIHPEQELVNKGKIVEAFVGQELLAYTDPWRKYALHYWQRDSRGSTAEIDYVFQRGHAIVPIEVKAGKSKQMKSLYSFMQSHPEVPHGLKFSINNAEKKEKIENLPLYAVAKQSPILAEIRHWLFDINQGS